MDTDVQTDSASEGAELNSTPEVKTEGEKNQPLTEEILNQRISEATKVFTEQVEAAKRELQSAKDKHKLEIERARNETQIHKNALDSIKSSIGESDPDVVSRLELAELRAKEKARAEADQYQTVAQQQQALIDSFNSGLTEFIKESGIDVSDKRIDWGDDAKTLLEKQQRILKSVNKIQKELQKNTKEEQTQAFKDMEMKLRKELGLDSVDTSKPMASHTDIKTARGKISKGWEEIHKIK